VLKEIAKPISSGVVPTAAVLASGPLVTPLSRLVLYSDKEWEAFIEEWAYAGLKHKKVMRAGGAGDLGIDVAGFDDDKELLGVWQNYQCKHYDHALWPSDAWPDMGKLLWHAFNKKYVPPKSYNFVAPRGVGTSLNLLLSNQTRLRAELVENWDKYCRKSITQTSDVPLEGDFATYVEDFDFGIFKAYPVLDVIAQHKTTTYYAQRFGGGLPPRPQPSAPPPVLAADELVYTTKLLEAYADHVKTPVVDASALKTWPKLAAHFGRQREAYYHAEALRVFVRDKVEPGTFESLQDEIYSGVVDTQDAEHPDEYIRVVAVTKAAHQVPLEAHALGGQTMVRDREGICHQLANEDRLSWKK